MRVSQLSLLLLTVVRRAACLARCQQSDLTYQIMSGFVFTHTDSILSTEVSRGSSAGIKTEQYNIWHDNDKRQDSFFCSSDCQNYMYSFCLLGENENCEPKSYWLSEWHNNILWCFMMQSAHLIFSPPRLGSSTSLPACLSAHLRPTVFPSTTRLGFASYSIPHQQQCQVCLIS